MFRTRVGCAHSVTPWWSDTLGSDLNAYLGCLSANKKTIFLDQELKKKEIPKPIMYQFVPNETNSNEHSNSRAYG